MFGVGEVDIGDVVYNLTVNLLGDILIKTTVAGLHMEDRDLEPLGRDGCQRGVGITKDQEGIGFLFYEYLIRFGDDISHRLTQVSSYTFKIMVRRTQSKIFEEHLVQGVVVVLTGMD